MTEHSDRISIEFAIPASVPEHARRQIFGSLAEIFALISECEGTLVSPRQTSMRSTSPLASWDRAHVLQQIEEASGVALNATDSLPDSLIATAQAAGLQPHELGVWIYDTPHGWNPGELVAWAKRNGFGKQQEGQQQ